MKDADPTLVKLISPDSAEAHRGGDLVPLQLAGIRRPQLFERLRGRVDGSKTYDADSDGEFESHDLRGSGYFAFAGWNGRADVLSALGKSAGIFCVTLPVAAHSVPRRKVVMNPTPSNASVSWPSVV